MNKAIITGITGQDGAYLSQLLIQEGYSVVGLVRNINSYHSGRLEYLGIDKAIQIEECNLVDLPSIISLLKKHEPEEIYNLAAQSSVGVSFREPISTIQVNSQSVLTLLEGIRLVNPGIKLYQASSSEMFGRIVSLPINEQSIMHPVSPYAISKATAYWSTVCYRESYGMYICNGILFNHESHLRGTNFFVKKLIQTAVSIKLGKVDVIRLGDLSVRRDFGYAPEYVKAMYKMLQKDTPDDYLICSGKSMLLRDIAYYVFDSLDIDRTKILEDDSLRRPNEIPDIYGDNTKAKSVLGWEYDLDFTDVLDILIELELKEQKIN